MREAGINAQRIKHHNASAVFAQSETDVEVAKLEISEYLEGTYRQEKQALLREFAYAESQRSAAIDAAEYARRMFNTGYYSSSQLEGSENSLEFSKIELDLLQTRLDVLERYTKTKQLQQLAGALKSKQAKMSSDKASLDLEKERLNRVEDQLKNCLIEADTSGIVIFPTTEQWKNQPNIEEGATVREDQVLLMIPDLEKMQVKLGVHEAYVDRLKPGMTARIQLQGEVVEGEVLSVASVTRPAGWWNGNQVKYDTIVKLNSLKGLKPGMSASVEVQLARHQDVLTVPVAAVVEQDEEFYCWVRTAETTERRHIDIGDSNDQFIVVKSGLTEGDHVVLNPRAYIKAYQNGALTPSTGLATASSSTPASPAKKSATP